MELNTRHELEMFGNAIRRCRKKSNISQEALAALATIDRSYLSAVERGQHNVALLNILKIAEALKISASELFEYRGQGK